MLQKLVRRGVDIFERDSLLWGLSLREALIFAVVPFLIMLGMMAIVPVPPATKMCMMPLHPGMTNGGAAA